MRFLGHKNIKNTLIYIQLAETIFKETNDQFACKVAKTIAEAAELIEAGFDFVHEYDRGNALQKTQIITLTPLNMPKIPLKTL